LTIRSLEADELIRIPRTILVLSVLLAAVVGAPAQDSSEVLFGCQETPFAVRFYDSPADE
jgi:hypothetical protein